MRGITRSLFLVSLLGCVWTGEARAALIAEVRTSLGNFSIDLNYKGARRTVSHFIRLAEGLQPWLDERTGKVVYGTRFYDGLKFYKKVDEAPPYFPAYKKYIQAGARSPGDPFVSIPDDQQGAGYALRDEIRHYATTGNMVVPHELYTVTMANTGPHSSSSQFLINLVNDTSWNERNSAFGMVQQLFREYDANGVTYTVTHNGLAVVNAIHSSTTPVTIYSIRFRITDNSPATGFDTSERATELPSITKPQITSVTRTSTQVHLGYTPQQAAEMRMYYSTDLFTWVISPRPRCMFLRVAPRARRLPPCMPIFRVCFTSFPRRSIR